MSNSKVFNWGILIKLLLIIILVIIPNIFCLATDAVFIDVTNEKSIEAHQVELACNFYGINVKHLILEKETSNFIEILDGINFNCIILPARTLPYLELDEVLDLISKNTNLYVPILIVGLNKDINSIILKNWSGGAIKDCLKIMYNSNNCFYKVSEFKDLAFELAGQNFPVIKDFSAMGYKLIVNKDKESKVIVEIINKNTNYSSPIFLMVNINGVDIFFHSGIDVSQKVHNDVNWKFDRERFFELAPILMFLRYTFGEKCWHRSNDYANLTIDDPYLIEPYGNLSYVELLNEMEETNFHTTIAFTPWNYDRNKQNIISLFHEYPERYSISIHGNNHDHREFYKYQTGLNDPIPARPLREQEADIKQAIARMEKFKNLTGLDYDKVMIFPHGISPAKTFSLLKKYNFIATCNSNNVPLDSTPPVDPLFQLRTITVDFENFPSLKRYKPLNGDPFSVEQNRYSELKIYNDQSSIAIDLFLDNPVLLYTHQDFFKNDISAFNATANIINSLTDNVIWESLGSICQYMYLQKLREDGNYDILAFTSNFILENDKQKDIKYFIKKEESFNVPIKEVFVDGASIDYETTEKYIHIILHIPPQGSKHVVIEYENNLSLESIDISKNDRHIFYLRKISDFRDLILSKTILGSLIVKIYYESGIFNFNLKKIRIIFLILIIFIISVVIYIKIKKAKNINPNR